MAEIILVGAVAFAVCFLIGVALSTGRAEPVRRLPLRPLDEIRIAPDGTFLNATPEEMLVYYLGVQVNLGQMTTAEAKKILQRSLKLL